MVRRQKREPHLLPAQYCSLDMMPTELELREHGMVQKPWICFICGGPKRNFGKNICKACEKRFPVKK